MASAIGTALISTILPPMAAKAMAMVVDKVDGIVNIKREISRLQTTLSMIQGIVQVAEEKQIDDVFIQNWLRDLVDIAYEARDVLDDFNITFPSCIITEEETSNPVNFIFSLMLCCFGGSSSDTSKLPLAILNRLEKDIKGVRERFDEKKKEGETFATLKSVVGGGSESMREYRRPEVGPFINKQRDNLFLGRGEEKEGIMEKILQPSDDNRVHVVTIWGMGGIGKTTLAQSIYNDGSVEEHDYPTENRKWLCVGENKLSAKEIITKIICDSSTDDVESLQKKLVEKFKGNRFLIVLDDVWDVDGSEWDLLFNPLTNVEKGGLIIITTRRREVCTATNTQTSCDLKPLSEEDSWSIFESCAYINGKCDSTPELKCIGKEIVKKLNGLPLALKVVGCSLLDKDSSTWTNFLESKLTKDDEVMSALRWSYNHLPPHLKMCFTYCSLFPKDHVFIENVLVEMWMAHDLIQKEKQKRPEDVGAHYFKQLVNTSLLQCVAGKHVMHDLIHDLALLVSNGEFATANGLLSVDQMEEVRHINLTHCDYSKIPRLCKIEKLLTLYTIRSHDSVLDDVLKQLKSIRVLVLSNQYKIKEIPKCISELKHLRYLDVSETGVESLPYSLCHLYNLQMLAAPLYAVLPRDIVNMVNLRYVRANLSTCKGVGKLTSLQELSSIHVCEGDNIRELGDMQRLRGKLRIEGLENVTSLEGDVGALMEKQTLMDKLELQFHQPESTISAQVLDAFGCPPNLTYLKIVGYTGVKSPSWMVDGKHKFHKLQTLELYDCCKLESLPPLGELNCLKHLSLKSLHGVKRLGEEFYGKFTDSKVFFPSLESLVFKEMNDWEEWDDIIIENSSVSFFPLLTRLELSHCPKLESLPPLREFDKLQTLELSNCHKLESLPPLGELTSLKRLSLREVGVKRLGDEFYGKFTDGKVFFPSLESLEFSWMREWEEWDDIIIKNFSVSFFPCLTGLEIKDCAKLVSVLPIVKNRTSKQKPEDKHPIMNVANFMTSLSRLEIRYCDGLKRLQLDALVSLKDLDISSCKSLVHITSGICLATTIERLQICSCEHLETMDFERLPSLNNFVVRFCDNLISIPRLHGIKFLELLGCESLRTLSFRNVHALDSLKDLWIFSCPVLELAFEEGSSSSSSGNSVAVPLENICTDNMQVFKKLTGLENFGETEENNFCKIKLIKNTLCLLQCEDLKSLHFHKLSSLESLRIEDCPQLQSLPSDFHKLSSLKELNIKSCPQLQSLHANFYKLSSLKHLCIEDCPQLQSLPPDFHKFSSLNSLIIKSCPQLQSLPSDFHKLSYLKKLRIEDCPQLQSLPPDFHKLSSLKKLMIEDCPQLQSLPPDFHKLSSLEELDIKSCPQLQSLPVEFYKLSSLKSLCIEDCPQLQSLPPDFHKLSSLEDLHINNCPQLQSLPAEFYKLSSLKSLCIEDCPQLQSLPPDFHKLSSLEELNIKSRRQLQSLTNFINSLVIAYQQPLEERCKLESGHVWHQIKHILDIYLSAGEHNYISVFDDTLVDYYEEEEEEERGGGEGEEAEEEEEEERGGGEGEEAEEEEEEGGRGGGGRYIMSGHIGI